MFFKYITPYASGANQFRRDPNFQIFILSFISPSSPISLLSTPPSNSFSFLLSPFLLPAQLCQVKSPNADDDLSPEELIKKNEDKRLRDMYVAFVLRCLKTIYIKIEPDPGVNVEHRLQVSSDPLSLPGAIRFDALCQPKELQEVASWEMIQEMMERRMPQQWVQQEKKNDEYASEFSFGRPGERSEGAPTGDIASRLNRLQGCR